MFRDSFPLSYKQRHSYLLEAWYLFSGGTSTSPLFEFLNTAQKVSKGHPRVHLKKLKSFQTLLKLNYLITSITERRWTPFLKSTPLSFHRKFFVSFNQVPRENSKLKVKVKILQNLNTLQFRYLFLHVDKEPPLLPWLWSGWMSQKKSKTLSIKKPKKIPR